MQQPSNNLPGGPYGNSPSPPTTPPRRGASPVLYCLGCLGIAGLIVVVGFIVVGLRSRALRKPIPAAEIRTVLPAGVPIYPRFSYDESASRWIMMPGASGSSISVLSFRCPDKIGTVGAWYEQRLLPQGWTRSKMSAGGRQCGFAKGDATLTIQAVPGNEMMQVWVAHGLPTQRRGTKSTPFPAPTP